MTREELDFIGSMNMCDEISNEAYKKIVCHCEEQEPCEDAMNRILKRMWNCRGKHTTSIDKVKMEQILRDELPLVNPQTKPDDFAKWVAKEIFDEDWEYNKDAFAEIACRKLAKLGIVRANGDEWELVEQESCDTCEHSDEIDGSNCYECVKGIRDRYDPQPCPDAISRRATLEPYKILNDTDTLCVALIRANIMQQPPVNPQPKTGHWDSRTCKCSECSYQITFSEYTEHKYKYCPNCGAKMVEPQESEVSDADSD